MSELKNQAQEIDKPGEPLQAHEYSISNLMPTFKDNATSTARQQYDAEIVKQRKAPIIQGEFQDFDPTGLDKGIMSGMDQNEVRAENQSGWQQLGAAAVQVANELVLGTAESVALMGDLKMHAGAITGEEQKFSNTLSDYLRQTKEEINAKYGKVYLSKEDSDFSPLSGSWWASNAGNMATALSLMIPATGVVKGLGAIAKGTKALRAFRLGNAGKAALKGITGAVSSRLVENAMEAGETVRALQEELKGQTNPTTGLPFTEEEINTIAGEAGRSTWIANSVMLAQDFVQFSKAFKGIDYARKTMEHATKKSILSKVGGFIAKDMGSEGLEEGYQYISSQESKYHAKKNAGLEGESEFLDRLGQYVTNDEFKTSVLLGAVGGAVFAGAGAITSAKEAKTQHESRMRLEALHKKNESAIAKNPERFAQAEDTELVINAIQKAETQDLDLLEADLNDLYYTADSDLEAQGLDPKEYRAKVSRAKDIVSTVAKEYNRVANEDINPELKSATLYSRIDRKLTELHKVELSKAREELKKSDIIEFTAKEVHTAEMMANLKELVRNGDIAKADKLATTIVDVSNGIYKTKEDVMESLSTSNDGEYNLLDNLEIQLNDRVQVSKEFDKKLKTELGQQELLTSLKEREAKRKIQAEENAKAKEDADKKKADKLAKDEEIRLKKLEREKNMTPEERSYLDNRESKIKELGEYDPGKPDGKKVFTTSNKGSYGRTWVAGETVKDSKGIEYKVIRPNTSKNSAVLLTSDGKYTSSWIVERSGKSRGDITNPISPESIKVGQEKWTVNKFVFQDNKAIEKEIAKKERQDQAWLAGVLKTVNQEFENYVPVGQTKPTGENNFTQTIYKFDGTPVVLEGEDRYDIDYTEAASIFNREEGVDKYVTLETDNSKGEEVILVKKGDKILALLDAGVLGDKFEKFYDYIDTQSIDGIKTRKLNVILKGKYVTAPGNLGNIIGEKQSVRVLTDSEFLYGGEIYIGSRKPGQDTITFVSESGKEEEANYNRASDEESYGAGNTYILMVTPNGDKYPVMLKESSLSEVIGESGLSKAEEAYNELDKLAKDLTDKINNRVRELVEKGDESGKQYNTRTAIVQAKKEFGEDRIGDTGTIIGNALSTTIDPLVRRVRQTYKKDPKTKQVLLDSKGNPIKNYTSNYFNVSLIYKEVDANTPGEIHIGVTKALPKIGTTNEFEPHQAKTKDEAITFLGERFMPVSLDIMNSPNGGEYVTKMINEGWFSTDLNATRPWVNTRLVLELDAETKTYMGEGVKVKSKKDKTKSKKEKSKDDISAKKSEKETAIQNTVKSKTGDSVKQMMSDAMKLGDFSEDKVSAFVETHLSDIVTIEEFSELVLKEAQKLKAKNPDMMDKAALRNAARSVSMNLVEVNATKEVVETVTHEVETKKVEKEVSKTVDGNKSTKERKNNSEIKPEKPEKGRKSLSRGKSKSTQTIVDVPANNPSNVSNLGIVKSEILTEEQEDNMTDSLDQITNHVADINTSKNDDVTKDCKGFEGLMDINI